MATPRYISRQSSPAGRAERVHYLRPTRGEIQKLIDRGKRISVSRREELPQSGESSNP